jgi:hypothetical protein
MLNPTLCCYSSRGFGAGIHAVLCLLERYKCNAGGFERLEAMVMIEGILTDALPDETSAWMPTDIVLCGEVRERRLLPSPQGFRRSKL